jgi:hypothetical protein
MECGEEYFDAVVLLEHPSLRSRVREEREGTLILVPGDRDADRTWRGNRLERRVRVLPHSLGARVVVDEELLLDLVEASGLVVFIGGQEGATLDLPPGLPEPMVRAVGEACRQGGVG